MNETSKSHYARLRNGDYAFLRGEVLDVGAGRDAIKLNKPANVRAWDIEDGDAQYLHGLNDESFDVVFSSHCAEHMVHFPTALENWSRVCKVGGCVYIVVPEWHTYEHMQWPSRYNEDHKSSFSLIDLGRRPSHPYYSFKEMKKLGLSNGLTLVDARVELDNFDFKKIYDLDIDQTLGNALAQCVFIYMKY